MRISTFRILSQSRLGYRGGMLLAVSVVDVLYGWSIIDPSADLLKTATYEWRALYAPPWVWGSMWIMVGLVCLLAAFCEHDAAGYAAAIGVKVFWALIALASWAVGGVDRGWVMTLLWGGVAVIAAIASSWPEPAHSRLVTAVDVQTIEIPDAGDE